MQLLPFTSFLLFSFIPLFQDAFTEKDDMEHNFSVMREIYASIVRTFPISDEQNALDEGKFSDRGERDERRVMGKEIEVIGEKEERGRREGERC